MKRLPKFLSLLAATALVMAAATDASYAAKGKGKPANPQEQQAKLASRIQGL